MDFEKTLNQLCDSGAGFGLRALGSELDAEWVRAALERTGTYTIRRRKLPAEQVVWLVVGMALFRDHSIEGVVRRLGLACSDGTEKRASVVGGAIPKARRRVGEAPLRELFRLTGERWGHEVAAESPWCGLSVYAIDGSCLSVPDTAENRKSFGLPKTGRGQSGYPKVRLVALMNTRGHILIDAELGPFHGKGTGEMKLAEPLWDKVPDNSLLLVDRGFLNYERFWRFRTTGQGRHWLVRMKSRLHFQVTQELGKGDYLATVPIDRKTRYKHPDLPAEMPVRILHYQVEGHEPQRLMTSLLDADQWPADDVIRMYHERWEIELGYRELKTHMLERKESLRSKTPEGVRQEIWGLLTAYNLVRRRMAYAASRIGQSPTRMSFRYSMMLVRAFCIATAWTESLATIPRHLAQLDEELEEALLPARRGDRSYPRWVKVKISGYKRNPGAPNTMSSIEKVS